MADRDLTSKIGNHQNNTKNHPLICHAPSEEIKEDRVFHTKGLTDIWDTDTMDGQVKSLDGN